MPSTTLPARRVRSVGLALLIAGTIAGVTWLALASGANATTAGFAYLIAVLLLATRGGWVAGAAASFLAFFGYNYFFLPPYGTLTIAQPANWVALAAFLAASTLASHLVTTARHQAEEAQRRRTEVETLYDLCFGLFTSMQGPGALADAATRTLRAMGAEAGALYLLEPRSAGGSPRGAPWAPPVVRAAEPASPPLPEPAVTIGTANLPGDGEAYRRALATHEAVENPSGGGEATAWVPLHVGGKTSGVLAARGALASRAVVEPAARLLALAIERERLLAEAAHLEAVRQSDALKTSLLRAVSHDLRTPLTAIRIETESLERRLAGRADEAEVAPSLRTLAREQERLARRIDNLLALARVEAGVARPRPEPVPPADLFRAARESLASILAGREVSLRIEPGCADLWADPSLTLEIVVNLLENAARATPADAIELAAGRSRTASGRVWVEVRDRGSGLPQGVRRFLSSQAEPLRGQAEPEDSRAGGLGLRIARGLAEANGGTLSFADRPGGGTIAFLDLPAAPEAA